MTTSVDNSGTTPGKAQPMNMHVDAVPGTHSFRVMNMHVDLRIGSADGSIVLTGVADGAGVISVRLPALLANQIKTVVQTMQVSVPPRHCTESPAAEYVFTKGPSVGSAKPDALVLTGPASNGTGKPVTLRVEISSAALAQLKSNSEQL